MRPLLGQTLVVVLVTGLVLALIGSGALVVALRAGIAPDFDQRITLDAQHILVLHNGPQPTCTVIPTPPAARLLLARTRAPCVLAGLFVAARVSVATLVPAAVMKRGPMSLPAALSSRQECKKMLNYWRTTK